MPVAALFVETAGGYFGLPDVDPWDIARDARRYGGPYPVVAHPPCERWGRYAEGSPMKRGYVPGDDDGCFIAALRAVIEFGGVLEHPAHSKAWAAHHLAEPRRDGGWTWCPNGGGWTCQVEQGHYGHPARKPTWIYAVGTARPDLIWGPAPQRLPARRLAERGYESARRCGIVGSMSHRQRQRTPVPFRDLVLTLARTAGL